MADLPEKIVCPTCGVENSPSAKTCTDCGSDLTVVVGVISSATKHYNAALRLAEEGMVDHALIEAESAVELWDRNPHFHNLLGTLYARKGLLDKAVAEWKKTLSLDPTMEKAADNIEKARKLELLKADQAARRPFYIAIAALAGLAVVLLGWGGYSQQRASRLTSRVTLLEQDRAALDLLRTQHARLAENLEAARLILAASAEAEENLRREREAESAELARAIEQLQVKEREADGLVNQLSSVNARVAELEKVAAAIVPPAELKAMRDESATLKSRVGELEKSLKAKDQALAAANGQLQAMGTRLDEETGKLAEVGQDLSATRSQLAAAGNRAASLEERLGAMKDQMRRWDLRNAELAQILRLAQDRRYVEATARLEELRRVYGPDPLADVLDAGINEDLRVAQDPFEQELRWSFEKQRRENEPRLRQEFAAAHLAAAERLFRDGMYHKALSELDLAEAISPGLRKAADLRSRIQGEQKQTEATLTQLLEAADAAAAAGKTGEAERLLREALANSPEHPVASERLARLQAAVSPAEPPPPAPEETYAQALAEAESLLRRGELAEADRLIELLERSYPRDQKVARMRAAADARIEERRRRIPRELGEAENLFLGRRYGEVVELLDDVLYWQPDNRWAATLRDVAADRLQLIEEAFAIAEDLYTEGRYEEARAAVERILTAQPNHAGAKQLDAEIAAAVRKR